jgi:hypothetical protein
MLMLSTVIIIPMPIASATTKEWTEWSFNDFNDSAFRENTMLNSMSGGDGNITLVKKLDWHNKNPSNSPGERDGFGFAFDSQNNVVVLFGGRASGAGKKNDTWEYDYEANTWTEIIADGSTGSPPRRSFCRMDFDSSNNVIVLWGGVNESGFPLTDTWEYDVDANTWNQTTPKSSPPVITGYALAYDSEHSRILMTGTSEPPPAGVLHLWAYDAAANNWTERTPTPYPRAGHDMAFNGAVMVVQGGAWGVNGEITYDDTLKYDYGSDSWARMVYGGQRNRPGPRTGNSMARYFNGVYDVGGFGELLYFNDTWNFTGTGDGWDWVDETPVSSNPQPPPCDKHGLVWDTHNNVLILYGGYSDSGRLDDTWAYTKVYAAVGWYVSEWNNESYFDSRSVTTEWQRIWWNDTSQPSGSRLMFQLQSGNLPDPAEFDPDRTFFVGPGNSDLTYYEIPGEMITDEHLSHRYIRYKAYFEGIPYGTPTFDDITIAYDDEGSPFIDITDPGNDEAEVPLGKNITLIFNEPMDTGTVTWTINPDPSPGNWIEEWGENDTELTLKHPDPFEESTRHMVTFTGGKDLDGNDLIDPYDLNPWNFTTLAVMPWIEWTDPFDDEIDVESSRNIVVQFSEPMINTTVEWTISPDVSLLPEWSDGNTTLFLNHTSLYTDCKEYSVWITAGMDLHGNSLDPDKGMPNPWIFTTYCDQPYVTNRDPEHGTIDVLLDGNIVITFSEEMNTTTVTWYVDVNMDGPGLDLGWSWVWEDGNTVLNISHSTLLADEMIYWVNVTYGEDLSGYPLNRSASAPNPWYFRTMAVRPWVVSTDPSNGTTSVSVINDIEVVFSEAMNPTTLSWSIAPDPSGWSEEWNPSYFILYLNHSNPFDENQVHNVDLSCNDTTGNPLTAGPVPNPWWFETGVAPPYVISTDPYDGEIEIATDSNIIVTFSEEMNTSTVMWWFSDPAIVLTPSWDPSNITLMLSHTTPFDKFITYTVNITEGEDLLGIPLEPGLVPNPWSFTTYTMPPGNLTVSRQAPDILLSWDVVLDAIEYRIYESQDRFAFWPWILLGTVNAPSTQYLHVNAHDNGTTHFYIVRAFNGLGDTGNSTMGVKAHRSFSQPATPDLTDINWLSLPLNSIYKKASDIANELTEDKIRVIGKWNPARQKSVTYTCAKGKWKGKDFAINSGDGVFIAGIQQDFDWTMTGSDTEITLDFTYYPRHKKNLNWVSIPYTGIYFDAMSIVVDIEPILGPPSKILEVGRWNATIQEAERFYWNGTAWTGTHFTIKLGDGIYIRVTSSFAWQIELIIPTIP